MVLWISVLENNNNGSSDIAISLVLARYFLDINPQIALLQPNIGRRTERKNYLS